VVEFPPTDLLVVLPLLGQRPADANLLDGHGLRWHAIRRPAPRVPRQGLGSLIRLPLQVVTLARVLCGVRAFPPTGQCSPAMASSGTVRTTPKRRTQRSIKVAAAG